jgi:Zn-dependent protease
MPVPPGPHLADTSAARDGRSADIAPRWPLERILFALAGTVTLVSVALAVLVSPWFLVLTAFVGVNQWLYVTVRGCPASLVLQRVGVAPRCRW